LQAATNLVSDQIDRIIDEGESEDGIFFLVKWCAQTYDLCTWESQETVELVSIAEVLGRKQVDYSNSLLTVLKCRSITPKYTSSTKDGFSTQ
jgi:hypothetical protein